jgi:ADP-heptose:LPS heptosyltransferase
VLGAKPELKGALKFREVDSLNLKFADGRGGARPFVLFPDSRRADKRWGGFKQLTEMILREDRSRKVVWAGSNFLPDRGAFSTAQFLNLTGNTSLVSLPALVKRADWVVTNDSGPMHLAAALGVRVFAISYRGSPQPCHPGAGGRPEASLGARRLRPLPEDTGPLTRREAGHKGIARCSTPN